MKTNAKITGFLCALIFTCTLNAQITVQEEISNTQCYNSEDGTIDITVSGGISPYSYIWSNGSTNEDLEGLTADIYNLTVTDAQELKHKASFVVGRPDPINMDVYIDKQNLCYDETTFAIAAADGGTGNLSYSWNDPQYQTGVKATDLSGGSYTVVVTDANNCIASSNFSIYEAGQPVTINENHKDITCKGGNDGAIFSSASGGTAPYSYKWSNYQTTKNIKGLTAGSYTISVTDKFGCITSKTITLNELYDSISFGVKEYIVQDVTCYDGSNGMIQVMVNDTIIESLSFNWEAEEQTNFNFADTNMLSGLTADAYNLTITDQNGCVLNANYTVSQPPAVIIDSTDVILPTEENYGKIRIYADGGAGDLRYSINSGQDYYNNNGVFDQVPPGRYLVAVKDITGCEVFGNVLKIYSFEEEEQLIENITEEPLREGEMHVYPNPSNGLFYVEFKNPANQDFMIDVYNMNGLKVYSRNYESTADHVWVELNIVDQPSGIYFIFLNGTGLNIKEKVLIQ